MSSEDDPNRGLARLLKDETRAAHLEAERVFVRAVKEGGLDAGPAHLMGLNVALVAWLTREARAVAPSPLAAEIAEFVAVVDAARAPALAMPPLPPGPALESEEEIAGAAYAVCGSFLGAAALARGWGTGSVPGFAAFCAASATLERRWPAFRQALDAFGRAHAGCAQHAVIGAERAFAYAREVVATLGESRTAMRAAEHAS
ncbi:hypothetical protein [Salinarimonas sp.]|uniref:hypothetical protein n=1 Tax=Salinarimonas sp. TaxID=2766526 RepID=UPI003919C5A5